MGKYETIATVNGPNGTAEVKHEVATLFDCATAHLFYTGDYAVKSPSGSVTFHSDRDSAVNKAFSTTEKK